VEFEYTQEEGEIAVKAARRVVEAWLEERRIPAFNFPPRFSEMRGVFTTINTHPERELRGCIGFPEPVYPLGEAIVRSALAAAFEDPRFPPLSRREVDTVVFEVSLLTKPEPISAGEPQDLISSVEIGKHGLIAEKGPFRGLLLPQVPVEYEWSVEEFLSHTCWKAGLPPDCWKRKGVKFYRFSAEIFEEEEPRGRVVRKVLKRCTT